MECCSHLERMRRPTRELQRLSHSLLNSCILDSTVRNAYLSHRWSENVIRWQSVNAEGGAV